jgi:hypothetical protein
MESVAPPLNSDANPQLFVQDALHYPILEFALSHYVSEGVRELDQQKLTPLLRLKYQNSIADAVADLGKADEIAAVFAGFQRCLYQRVVAQVAQASARVLRHG